VLPNVWDPGSAKVVAQAGFEALATTSAGIAFSLGLPDDGRAGRDAMVERVAAIVAAVPLPVSADIEAGYGPDPEDVAETIDRVIDAGAVGANVEDADRDGPAALFEHGPATERVAAARAAADRHGTAFTLNARIDSFLAGHPDPLADALARSERYVAAGADCIFVPGATEEAVIGELVDAIAAPLNVVVGLAGDPLDLATLDRLGVRRVSVGGSLARATLGLVRRAAEEMLAGRFGFTEGAITHAALNRDFAG